MISSNEELISELKVKFLLGSDKMEQAFRVVDRGAFVPEGMRREAYEDKDLLMREGQTLLRSASSVAFELGLLKLEKGHKVVDVGAGSGWTSCLIGYLVGGIGRVYAYEINEEVGKLGTQYVDRFGMEQVRYFVDDAKAHWLDHMEVDRIRIAGALKETPLALVNYLKDGGIMIFPTIDGHLNVTHKTCGNCLETRKYEGFNFRPLK